jgi:hypothetical protein
VKHTRPAAPVLGRSTLAGAFVVTCALTWALVATPARADSIADAGIQCQVEYGSPSELGVACLRGVKLAARAADDVDVAMAACVKGFENASMLAACRRGVALHTRLANATRGGNEKASFSYSWQVKRGAAQLDVGDYRLFLGDAEKAIDECMRTYEGSSTPPSCLSGLSAQQKPPK